MWNIVKFRSSARGVQGLTNYRKRAQLPNRARGPAADRLPLQENKRYNCGPKQDLYHFDSPSFRFQKAAVFTGSIKNPLIPPRPARHGVHDLPDLGNNPRPGLGF